MKVKVKRVIFYGKRYEPGEEANLPPEVVKAFGEAYVEPIKPKVKEASEEKKPEKKKG